MQIICDFHMEFSINVYTSCVQINHWKSYRLRMIIFFSLNYAKRWCEIEINSTILPQGF